MDYSLKFGDRCGGSCTQKTKFANGFKNVLILSAAVLLCVACGVRGPLTVNPKPSKDGASLGSNSVLNGTTASTAADLRTNPAAPVLYGNDGKQTLIPALPNAAP